MPFESVDRLEAGITRLLDEHNELKNENSELKEAIKARDEQITELSERLESVQRERGEVRERVETLIGRLDGLLHNA